MFTTATPKQWLIAGKIAVNSESSIKPEGKFSAVEFEEVEFFTEEFSAGEFSSRKLFEERYIMVDVLFVLGG